MSTRPVLLWHGNLERISVREWGLPTGMYIGKLWRSERRRTLTVLLPVGCGAAGELDERRVLVVDKLADQWIPVTWRRAMAEYRRAWPKSAPRLRGSP